MRRCLQCGTENLELARFCSNCGNPLLAVRSEISQPVVAPISPELPGSVVQQPPRQRLHEAARPLLQEPYPPSPRPQLAARPQEQSPFMAEEPFLASPSAASLPINPFVQLNRDKSEMYHQNLASAYAPTIFHNIPPGLSPRIVPPPKKKRRRLLFVLLGIVVIFVLIVTALFLLLSADKQPKLSIIQGQPAPGQQILLQGQHFPIGSKISVVVDTGLLVFSQSTNSFLLQSAFIPVSSTETNGVVYRASVGSDGTFTIKIRIPGTWKSQSQHTIIAEVGGTNTQQVKPVQYQMTIA